MREIKFRTWGSYCGDENKMHYLDFKSLTSCDMDGDNLLSHIESKEELMQYTGIKDKDSKEIYEGDIIECGYEQYEGEGYLGTYVPVHTGQVKYILNDGFYTTSFHPMCAERKYDVFNVIGNIYENPELLK